MEKKFVFQMQPGDVFSQRCDSRIKYCMQKIEKEPDRSIYNINFTGTDGTLITRTYNGSKCFWFHYHAEHYYKVNG